MMQQKIIYLDPVKLATYVGAFAGIATLIGTDSRDIADTIGSVMQSTDAGGLVAYLTASTINYVNSKSLYESLRI